jgi:hypothetical protein
LGNLFRKKHLLFPGSLYVLETKFPNFPIPNFKIP